MVNLTAAVNHANNYWYKPCLDGVVWTKSKGINVEQEAVRFGKDPQRYVGRFLLYDAVDGQREGLFLIPAADAHLGFLKAKGFDAGNFDDKVFLCSWSDDGRDIYAGQTPPYTGLNDCSHFVSECFKQAGVAVWALSAVQLVANIRRRADTKTLCYQVDKEAARRIINSNLMTPGDVIAFSFDGLFRHCTIYLGGRAIVMHTPLNHPHGPWKRETDSAGQNNWEASAHENHPEVTLIHFGHRDRDPLTVGWIHGWWEMSLPGGEVLFFYFGPNGKASYVSKRPTRVNAPPEAPEGKAYWFGMPGEDVLVCWKDSGTLDRVFLAGEQMSGTTNGEPLKGVRMRS